MDKPKPSLAVITEKLHSIVGVHSDLSVLAEFCEVMLKSKKPKDEIAKELETFLSDSAIQFSEWLLNDATAEISARDADIAMEADNTQPDSPREVQTIASAPIASEDSPRATVVHDVELAQGEQDDEKEDKRPRRNSSRSVSSRGTMEAPRVVVEDETAEEGSVVFVEDEEDFLEDDDKSQKESRHGDRSEQNVVLRARSPISTDERDLSNSPVKVRVMRKEHSHPRLRAAPHTRRPSPGRARYIAKKNEYVRSTRRVYSDRVSPLGNALLMARAVKAATAAPVDREPPKVRRQIATEMPRRLSLVQRSSLPVKRSPSARRRSRSRSARSVRIQPRKRRSRTRSHSAEYSSAPSGHSQLRTRRSRSPREPKSRHAAIPSRHTERHANHKYEDEHGRQHEKEHNTKRSRRQYEEDTGRKKKTRREESPPASPVRVKSKDKHITREAMREEEPIIVPATVAANLNLDEKQLEERISRLERLEQLQEQTRKNREELADMDIPLRLHAVNTLGNQQQQTTIISRSSASQISSQSAMPLRASSLMAPRRPTSPMGLGRQEPFHVVKWRVIVDKLDVTMGLVKAAGDPVKTLTKGEIVEQTSPQVVHDGVPMFPIAHPSSSKYPAPIGWVILDTTANGGQKCLEPGPAFIKGGKNQSFGKGKGKGKQPAPAFSTSEWRPPSKGWSGGGKGWGAANWSLTNVSPYGAV